MNLQNCNRSHDVVVIFNFMVYVFKYSKYIWRYIYYYVVGNEATMNVYFTFCKHLAFWENSNK